MHHTEAMKPEPSVHQHHNEYDEGTKQYYFRFIQFHAIPSWFPVHKSATKVVVTDGLFLIDCEAGLRDSFTIVAAAD